jgi:hypothetical protein
MHGTWHPASESLRSHPRCKCVQQPATRKDARDATDGSERFAKLSQAEQAQILGPGKADAYRQGQITLADIVSRDKDGYVSERPLKALVKN